MTSRAFLSFLLLSALPLTAGCASARRDVAVGALLQNPRFPTLIAPWQPHRDVTVRTDDGFTLRGWRFDPEGTPKGVIVWLHGKADTRVLGIAFADAYVRQGWAVVALDLRAHGESEGPYSTYGFREVSDVQRILDHVGLDRAILVGHSLGAAIALQTAAVDPRVRGVVAASSFSDLEIIAKEAGGVFARSPEFVAAVDDRVLEQAGFRMRDISPREAAKKITVPVLLLHGIQDALTASTHSVRIYENLAGPKRLVLVDGAQHWDVFAFPQVWAVMDKWLHQLPPPATTGAVGPSAAQ